jgi:hypothetical protein
VRAPDFSPRYVQTALDNQSAKVAHAAPGSRNVLLNSAAYGLARISNCTDEAIFAALTPAAAQCGYTKDEGPRRVQETIRRAITAGRAVPRAPTCNRHERRRAAALDHHRRPVVAPTTKPVAPGPCASPLHQAPIEGALFPPRTPPDENGKPYFGRWDGSGPPVRDGEVRRHVFLHAGRPDAEPVRIKIKNADGTFTNWYAVTDGDVVGWQAKKPDHYVDVPCIGAVDPFDPELSSDRVFWTEGERDTETLGDINLPAFSFGGCGDGLPPVAVDYVTGRHLVIVADNDDAGKEHAAKKAALCASVAASVRVLHFPELPRGGDVTDFVKGGGTHEDLMRLADEAPPWTPVTEVPSSGAATGRGLVVQRASEIAPEKIEWVWTGRIARGKHTTIAGDPGVGKSQVTINIAATVTTGGRWPCDEGQAPLGDVIFLSAEDGVADTIIPRLMAAGADLERIHVVTTTRGETGNSQSFNLQADIDLLEREVQRIGSVALIIIDPVSAYMGGADSHKNAEVRSVLAPISEMAERTRVAILTVTHLSKGSAGGTGKALYRFIGSIAFTAAPRAAFVVVQDQEDRGRCLFLHGKNNLAAPPKGLAYRLEQRLVDGDILASSAEWESKPVDMTADQAMAAGNDHEPTAMDDAAEFLRAVLADGRLKASEIQTEARAAGLLSETRPIGQSKPFRRAKEALGIKTSQMKGEKAGGWYWELPGQVPSEVADAL